MLKPMWTFTPTQRWKDLPHKICTHIILCACTCNSLESCSIFMCTILPTNPISKMFKSMLTFTPTRRQRDLPHMSCQAKICTRMHACTCSSLEFWVDWLIFTCTFLPRIQWVKSSSSLLLLRDKGMCMYVLLIHLPARSWVDSCHMLASSSLPQAQHICIFDYRRLGWFWALRQSIIHELTISLKILWYLHVHMNENPYMCKRYTSTYIRNSKDTSIILSLFLYSSAYLWEASDAWERACLLSWEPNIESPSHVECDLRRS